ncbi:hypothetical protein D1641_18820 [Colidextribacter sp. OB.20]|nr:hypothetical protein [Colidextribacter sp. OB.20]
MPSHLGLWASTLKIRHGNRVPIVVCGGNAVHMAKGDSLMFNTQKGRCERHYERTDPCIERYPAKSNRQNVQVSTAIPEFVQP